MMNKYNTISKQRLRGWGSAVAPACTSVQSGPLNCVDLDQVARGLHVLGGLFLRLSHLLRYGLAALTYSLLYAYFWVTPAPKYKMAL